MVTRFLAGVVDWLREGYPAGIPAQDTIPVLALLRRRLTDDEVAQIAAELRAQHLLVPDRVDVGTEITRITDEVPSEDELTRVFAHLAFRGFPVQNTGPDGADPGDAASRG